MKTLKVFTAIILIFTLGLLSGALGTKVYLKYKFKRFAEGKPAHHTNILMKKLTQNLDLTDAQQEEIKKILDNSMKDFRKKRKELLPQIHGPFSRNIDQIKTVLDDKQKEKLDTILAKRFHDIPENSRPHSRRNQKSPDLSLKNMVEKLNLTDDQITNVRPIIENFAKERKAVLEENRNRLQENRKILEKDFNELKDATTNQLEPFLTQEQLTKYKELTRPKKLPNQRNPDRRIGES